MNILTGELFLHHDFLRLTREHPIEIGNRCSKRYNNFVITLIDTGILLIEPESAGSIDIVISSGVHGNETAPIEICNLLVKEILDGKLQVNNRILFIIGNPPAMNSGERFEEENLNRLFCGKHIGKSHREAKRAALLEKAVTDFFDSRHDSLERCHFDLHTAIRASKYEKFAIYPYQDGRALKNKYLNFFKDSDINTILLAHQPADTFSYFSSHQFKANAFTVELGKVRPFGENDMPSFAGILTSLRLLIKDEIDFDDSVNNDDFNLFQVVDEVIRYSENNFSLNIDVKQANFSTFPVAFQLTTDDDKGYQMKSDSDAIVFPNAKVPVGHRVALIVSKTSI
ncbi:MAG: succinylglutamate desuccinylase [Gammaproteobacteria bacterium]|nr:succinylglutamate desuccinylase [Gammaproteobacteria bacterium]